MNEKYQIGDFKYSFKHELHSECGNGKWKIIYCLVLPLVKAVSFELSVKGQEPVIFDTFEEAKNAYDIA